jgi:hypothetical protein
MKKAIKRIAQTSKVGAVRYRRQFMSLQFTADVFLEERIVEGATSIVYRARTSCKTVYAEAGQKLAVKLFPVQTHRESGTAIRA